MHCVTNIHEDLYWLGGSDRQLAKFENVFPIPRGVSYNAYLVLDEKTVLLDTVDKAVGERFFENLEFALAGRPLDYVVVNHMEPDHCAAIEQVLLRHPEVKVVGNKKTFQMIGQFFELDLEGRSVEVAEGDTLELGRHTLSFHFAPMVHWPEVMVTYDACDKILFSADAFGTFGALNGNLFADEVDFEGEWLDDARRYYANIVGKYGPQVQNALKKLSGLDIQVICPLHGPVWRENLAWFLGKYDQWSRYEPEERAVAILYAISATLGLAAVVLTTKGSIRIALLILALLIGFVVCAFIRKSVHKHHIDVELQEAQAAADARTDAEAAEAEKDTASAETEQDSDTTAAEAPAQEVNDEQTH